MKCLPIKHLFYILLFSVSTCFNMGCSEDSAPAHEAHDAKEVPLNSQNTALNMSRSGENRAGTRPFEADPGNYAVAIDGKKISLQTLDEGIKLKLFDLEWARYELRKVALNDYLQDFSRQHTPQTIQVLLTPPEPPRLYLTPAQQNSALRFDEPEADTVRLSVFCNYQSSHCARMQATYQQLQLDYGKQIGFEFFDFPQAFHSQAVSAANAARCANSMGVFGAFHRALWLSQQTLNDSHYLRLAKQLGLDEGVFQACLTAQAHVLAIDAHEELAKSLGFNQVPVTLVNGLYLSGPKVLEVFKYFIDLELARLGSSVSSEVADRSNGSREASESGDKDSEAQDDSVGTDGRDAAQNGLPEDMPEADELEYTPRPVVPALGEIPLSRAWIEDQLLHQSELESHFQAAEHEVEGVRLTKLKGVADSEFYRTLGMQEGDVLMRINEQWVHEAQNDLFDFLETGDTVAVVLVRKGLPVHLVYRIKN